MCVVGPRILPRVLNRTPKQVRMAIRLSNLVKRYVAPDGSASTIIDVPGFELAAGEQVAMVGSSGSGKTTLLHLIAGLLVPDDGSIAFDLGEGNVTELQQLSEAARDVFRGRYMGYVFQTHHLLPGFTALENVLLGMSFTGRGADRKWAKQLLDEVGLSDRLNYKPAKLSVGQQQRVAVARALANKPKLVLADEPTGALDATNAQQVLDLMRKLCTEVGASLVIVTHDRGIAEQLPRVVELSEINRAAKPVVRAAPRAVQV
jgi:putative ABC transport system ATP-binding protein